MVYRREIDGLRALAVVPVILFHAGFQTFSGGYVGVDVFFVISGYLITSIIAAEKDAGKFTLAGFYERRARRILPALFLVMLACLPFAWLWLLPDDLHAFATSLAGVAAFSSNFIFLHRGGYFGTKAELSPMLHTWSLAVEEQYYLLFPLFLMLAWRWGKKWVVTLLAVAAVLSLGLAQWGSINMPMAAFYLLPTRGWELLIGAFAALFLHGKPSSESGSSVTQVAAVAGLALIIGSALFFDKQTPFPGFYALVPTVGAVLIILFATDKTVVGRFLGNKLLVGIGLVSYSAYLWHQPIFAFARLRTGDAPDRVLFVALTLVAFVAAYFSWKHVEAPFRDKRRFSRGRIFAYGAVGSLCFVAVALLVLARQGLPERFPQMASFWRDGDWPPSFFREEACADKYGREDESYCRVFDVRKPVTDALIGDSHANHFFPGLAAYLGKRDRNLILRGSGGCPPFLDVDRGNLLEDGVSRCYSRTNTQYLAILGNPTIKTVYLSFQHSMYFRDEIQFHDIVGELSNQVPRDEFLYRVLVRTVKRFAAAGKSVVFLYDMPDFKRGEPLHCLSSPPASDGHDNCDYTKVFNFDFAPYEKLLTKVSQETGAKIFRTQPYLQHFPRDANGAWLYRDENHFSLKGSLFFADKYDF